MSAPSSRLINQRPQEEGGDGGACIVKLRGHVELSVRCNDTSVVRVVGRACGLFALRRLAEEVFAVACPSGSCVVPALEGMFHKVQRQMDVNGCVPCFSIGMLLMSSLMTIPPRSI